MTAALLGVVQLPEGDHPDHEVTVLLQLQEGSRADAAADVVAMDRHTATLPATGAFQALPTPLDDRPMVIQVQRI